ncbi:hypothetical protein AB0K09_05055 [Streptomyces sp. NPDC049577]|uniref:hypothetical protein n=1 Tax=Streptomyces sp. NPDC049577 TaxID=3155153 RepID=UPI0034187A1D
MGLRDRWLGTKYPDSDVVPRSAAEVRDALLAVGGPHVPYRVRNAMTSEKADVVGEWWLQTTEEGRRVDRRLRIRMRLDPSGREIRALQEQWTATSGTLFASREYGRGSGFTAQWTYEKGPDGRRRKVKTLDTRDMRNALREAALGAGWTWRGVFRL